MYNGTAFQFIFSFHMPAFFILSGYVLKDEDMFFHAFLKKKWNIWQEYLKKGRSIFAASAVVSLLICIIFGCMLNTPVNMGALTYGNPFYYYISALSGSFMIVNVALLLKQSPFWEYFGRNSLIIFAFQAYVYNFIIYIINMFFNTEYIKMKNIPNMVSLIISVLAFLLWGCIVWIIRKIQFSIHKQSI